MNWFWKEKRLVDALTTGGEFSDQLGNQAIHLGERASPQSSPHLIEFAQKLKKRARSPWTWYFGFTFWKRSELLEAARCIIWLEETRKMHLDLIESYKDARKRRK